MGTYPRNKNGDLITSNGVSSILINPKLILSAVERHLNQYINELRADSTSQQASYFQIIFNDQIGNKEGDLMVAATEDELFGNA